MIRFQNIHKKYKQDTILSDITFEINKGELCVLIGPSGCGKTTLLKMINRLIKPTSGKIFLNEEDIQLKEVISFRRNIGYVIQQTGIFPHMTVAENIELIPKLQNEDNQKIRLRTIELMNMVSLPPDEYLNRYPTQLSGGQQQRVGVARAFACNPDVILMDEPFSALDPLTRIQLQEELILIQRKLKKTVVFVTHDMDEAVKIADKICILNEGSIAQYNTPEEILKNPANSFVNEFIGKHRIWATPKLIYAKDIMVDSPYVTLKTNITDILKLMEQNNIDIIPIIDSNKKLLGMVELTTIQNHLKDNIKIEKIMIKSFTSVLDKVSILDILQIVYDKKITNIPVVDSQGNLKGIITKSSLVITLSQQYIESEEVI